MDDDDDLAQSIARRLGALEERGGSVDVQTAKDLRVLCYLETLLGDRLAEAERHYLVRFADNLTALEALADQLEAQAAAAAEEAGAEERKRLLASPLQVRP